MVPQCPDSVLRCCVFKDECGVDCLPELGSEGRKQPIGKVFVQLLDTILHRAVHRVYLVTYSQIWTNDAQPRGSLPPTICFQLVEEIFVVSLDVCVLVQLWAGDDA